jgi:hypothetical protein
MGKCKYLILCVSEAFVCPIFDTPLCCSHPTPYIKQWESGVNGTNNGKAVDDVLWEPVLPGKHLNYLEISAGPNLTMKQDWFKQRMDFWDSLPLLENESQLADPNNFLDLVYSYLVYVMRL